MSSNQGDDLAELERLHAACVGESYQEPDDGPCRDYAFAAMDAVPALIQRLREAEARIAQLERVREAAALAYDKAANGSAWSPEHDALGDALDALEAE